MLQKNKNARMQKNGVMMVPPEEERVRVICGATQKEHRRYMKKDMKFQ